MDAFPDADAIIDRNIDTVTRLGADGWYRLLSDADAAPDADEAAGADAAPDASDRA